MKNNTNKTMAEEIKYIMKSTHATSCTRKECYCGVEQVEYELSKLFKKRSSANKELIAEIEGKWKEALECNKECNMDHKTGNPHMTGLIMQFTTELTNIKLTLIKEYRDPVIVSEKERDWSNGRHGA